MKSKIAIVVSTPLMVKSFLMEHIAGLSKDYDLTIVTNMSDADKYLYKLPASIHCVDIKIERDISPFFDVLALFRLFGLFRKKKFLIVHSFSPKGGLLAMLAAKAAGNRYRLHTFTGQVWVTKTGLMRRLLKFLDKVIASCATNVLADSGSQLKFLIYNKVVNESKSLVLGDGSISGVDVGRFRPDSLKRSQIREDLNISSESLVYLFVGRLKKDKGVLDLAYSFSMVRDIKKDTTLLMVGPDEDGLQSQIVEILSGCEIHVIFVPYTNSPESYMAAADVFCLPSYREGFGSTVIEAAACGIPSIGSRIYGLTDAIVEDETGLMVEPGSINELKEAIVKLAGSNELRKTMGDEAMKRVMAKFSQHRITSELLNLYKSLINKEI